MEIYIAEQVRLLCGAAALGAALGLAYDLLRAVRRRIPALLVPCDLLFCAAVAAGVRVRPRLWAWRSRYSPAAV